MGVQIAQFPHGVEGEGEVCEIGPGVRSCGAGVGGVGGVSDGEAGEEPVVGAVFEEVEEGHCGGGEAVDEEGFEDAF